MTQSGYTTRLKGSIRRNLEQIRLFGPMILLRHFRAKQPISRLNLRGFGPIHVRLDQSDTNTFDQIFHKGEYDLAILGSAASRVEVRYQAILASGKVPVIIDAGANVGAAALWFNQKYPEANIVSIEPEANNADVLRRNVEDRPRIFVREAAIASAPGRIGIAGDATGYGVQTERVAEGGIDAITMQDAISSIENGKPFIAKIDIEGFEHDLFATNTGWIDDFTMLMIEPHDWMLPGQFTSQNFQKEMGKRKYELFINGENLIYVAAL